MMNLGLLENKKTSVQKPRILLRPDLNKRFKPSRLIFRLGKSQSFYFSIEKISIYILNRISKNTIHIYGSVGNHVFRTLCVDNANIQLYKQKSIVINKIMQLLKINQ
jgi:hypothetical protein